MLLGPNILINSGNTEQYNAATKSRWRPKYREGRSRFVTWGCSIGDRSRRSSKLWSGQKLRTNKTGRRQDRSNGRARRRFFIGLRLGPNSPIKAHLEAKGGVWKTNCRRKGQQKQKGDRRMGNPKQKWTQEEEDALRQGVAKHGTGKWKDIQRDPEFNKFLFSRSNIDLKDKWRNLTGGGSGQGQRDKSRAKTKAIADATTSLSNQLAIVNASVVDEVMGEAAVDGSAKLVDETKSIPRYDDLISEALSNLNEPNGSEVGAVFSYIEKCHEVSQNFRRQLRARLKRLVVVGKLEENQNRYKFKEDAPLVAKAPVKVPAPHEQQDTRPRPLQSAGGAIFGETLDEAAIACAYRIAEAENKSFVAAEAVKEAERVAKMAEEAESIYQLTRELLERCSGDEISLVA